MKTIHLYGSFAKQYGKIIELDVASPFMAVRGLIHLFGDQFRSQFAKTPFNVVVGRLRKGNQALVASQVHEKTDAQHIHFVPVVKGSGKFGMVILGIVLIVVGVFFEQPWLIQLGVGVALGGVAQLLAPHPQVGKDGNAVDKNESYVFSGPANNLLQGGPVPLVYGECLAGSTVISASTSVDQISTGFMNNFNPLTVIHK